MEGTSERISSPTAKKIGAAGMSGGGLGGFEIQLSEEEEDPGAYEVICHLQLPSRALKVIRAAVRHNGTSDKPAAEALFPLRFRIRW